MLFLLDYLVVVKLVVYYLVLDHMAQAEGLSYATSQEIRDLWVAIQRSSGKLETQLGALHSHLGLQLRGLQGKKSKLNKFRSSYETSQGFRREV